MLVHFPIALIITGFLFASAAIFCKKCCQVEEKRKNTMLMAAFWLLALGSLSAIVAIISGYVFTPVMEGVMGTMRQTHICYACTATILSCLAAAFYAAYIFTGRKTQIIGYVIYLLAVIMIGATGHLGGAMVFGF